MQDKLNDPLQQENRTWRRTRQHAALKPNHILTVTSHQVRKSIRPTKLRASLKPGTVLILLAGRFRGKRVVLVKDLDQGVLLVTGPFKLNGVPLRRVNARYVIATSTRVPLEGLDSAAIDKVSKPEYFAREKSSKGKGEEAFFKQGEKPQVSYNKEYRMGYQQMLICTIEEGARPRPC